jgi:hypothetical protein
MHNKLVAAPNHKLVVVLSSSHLLSLIILKKMCGETA